MSTWRAHQAAADRVARAFGNTEGAPGPLEGETLTRYRQRLMAPFQQHSPAWKGANLSRVSDETTLAVAEDQIFRDAMRARTDPNVIGPGKLIETFESDRTGRQISRFYGDPEACWGAFKQPSRHVVGFAR
jgi:hypothetical protein